MNDENPAESPYSEEDIHLAQTQEQMAAQESAIQHLQARAVALNLEVRVRDRRIMELETELASHRNDDRPAQPIPDA